MREDAQILHEVLKGDINRLEKTDMKVRLNTSFKKLY